jgi:hypothetical protein
LGCKGSSDKVYIVGHQQWFTTKVQITGLDATGAIIYADFESGASIGSAPMNYNSSQRRKYSIFIAIILLL